MPLTSARIRAGFKNPPKTCRPMIRWWWPGGDVSDTEIAREVAQFDKSGFGGVEVQPFRFGLRRDLPPDAEARVNDFLTPTFFGHVRAATESLRQRGMWLDLTFGSGWPFGGGLNITPELASMELRLSRQTVHGPGTLHQHIVLPETPRETGAFVQKVIGGAQPLPAGWDERLERKRRLVAVIAIQGSVPETGAGVSALSAMLSEKVNRPGILNPASTQILTERVGPDGTLDWEVPPGDWQLLTFAESPADLWVLGGVGKYPQLVLDHMKLAAMESHLHRVGDAATESVGDLFGNGLRAIFCDSLEVRAYIFWTDSFLDDFRRLRGYDLTPYLPFLRQPGFADPYGSWEGQPEFDAPEVGDRVRRDYWQTVSDVMEANFYSPFDTWAHSNHLLARVQAHGAPADVFKLYGEADIPETEHLYAGGKEDFLRMAASAAHVYGRPIVTSESFAIAGNPYATTPERIKLWADQLFTSGINEIIFHGYPYQYSQQPGWYPFVSPLAFSSHLDEHNPFWEYLRPLNEYITRIQFLAQSGKNVAQVALYRSALSYEARTVPAPEIDNRLVKAGYNFDQFNTDALLHSRVENQKLITPGGSRYAALILVRETRIPLELAEKLAGFRHDKLPIYFVGSVPREEIGWKDWNTKSLRIQRLLAGAVSFDSEAQAISRLKTAQPPDIAYAADSASAAFFHRKIDDLDVYFVRNEDAVAKVVRAVFPMHSSPEEWDPWTGTARDLGAFEKTRDGVSVAVELPPYGTRVLVFDSANHVPSNPIKPVARTPTSLTLGGAGSRWTLSTTAVRLEPNELKDWLDIPELATYSGGAEYETRFKIDPDWLRAAGRVVLDLGEVHDVAEVTVNGLHVCSLFFRPFRCDISPAIRSGENVLQVMVTNTQTNHLLAQGVNLSNPAVPKTVPEHSGLIGPVQLQAATASQAYSLPQIPLQSRVTTNGIPNR